MKNIKSFLTAGTIALGLSVSAFSLPASAAGVTTINNADFESAASDWENSYNSVLCHDEDGIGFMCFYHLADGSYKLGDDIDLDGHTLNIEGDVTIDFNGHTILGNIEVKATGNLTLSGEGGVTGNVWTTGKLVINGGTFADVMGGALNIGDGAVVVINGGQFVSDAASAAYIMNFFDPIDVTINGGLFTSVADNGIEAEIECGGSSIKINGGTFGGDVSGLKIAGDSSVFKISGGQFVSGDAGHAIKVTSATGPVDSSAISALLVDGYEYSDGATVSGTDDSGPYLGLSAKDVTVRTIGNSTDEGGSETEGGSGTQGGSETEGDSEGGSESGTSDANSSSKSIMSEEMEKVIASATSKGSSKSTKASNKKVKAPNTGVTEGAVATTGATVITMATLAGAGLIIKKKQNR